VGFAEQVYSHEFDSIFFKLPPGIRQQIERKIDELGTRLDQFPHHRLTASDAFRLRVGDYRVIYQFDARKNIVYVITLGHRREIYR
jgi:mRNA interferase RelE/StbE